MVLHYQLIDGGLADEGTCRTVERNDSEVVVVGLLDAQPIEVKQVRVLLRCGVESNAEHACLLGCEHEGVALDLL